MSGVPVTGVLEVLERQARALLRAAQAEERPPHPSWLCAEDVADLAVDVLVMLRCHVVEKPSARADGAVISVARWAVTAAISARDGAIFAAHPSWKGVRDEPRGDARCDKVRPTRGAR